jgi:hypothetical protein
VHRLVDEKPLQAFDGLKQGPLIRKKILGPDAIAALENATEFIGAPKQKYLDLFYCSSIFWL